MAPKGFRVELAVLEEQVAVLRQMHGEFQQRSRSMFQSAGQVMFGTKEYAWYLAARHEWGMQCTRMLIGRLHKGIRDTARNLETTRRNYESADRLPLHGEPQATPEVPEKGEDNRPYPQPPQPPGPTSFDGYSHQRLKQLLEVGKPDTITGMAGRWRSHATELDEAGCEVARSLDGLAAAWEGEASEACRQQMRRLADTARNASPVAMRTGEALYQAAGTLRRKQQEMPDPVNKIDAIDGMPWYVPGAVPATTRARSARPG